jgi:ribosomal-protein-alanine N-acetyltransferase
MFRVTGVQTCALPIWQKYDSDPPLHDISEAIKVINDIRDGFASKKSINWGICFKEDNRMIGNMGFYFYNQIFYKGDLGYTVARPYWRQGIATEAIRALMKFGFEMMRFHRINVDTRMDNLASVGLMQKLGFRHEGARRECIRSEDGTYQTWGLFGMLEDEYRLFSSVDARSCSR